MGDGEGSREQGDRGGLDISPGLAVPSLPPLASGHHVPTVTTWNREGFPFWEPEAGVIPRAPLPVEDEAVGRTQGLPRPSN